ncbi:DEAD/DEAH box helicase [Bacillus sp. AGMB 02131]|uniref:DEAD/DEAH box helicase n=1 Tax=Peribacillus faecalis TaxID=2772559 RepID=A0A927CZR4_9BACI|nr:DEAD/DEAH box helicase [Peribacillus faecalis]MBD3108780.1 DEAD/DEAH box helicase [Peribacillus faecalis]
MNSSFINNLPDFLQETWKKEGFQKPTAIQEEAYPVIMNGSDLIAQSPTGTGKTLAYLLPLLANIDAESIQLQTVILASSRELVMQIHQEIIKWTAQTNIRSASFIGGANLKRQLEKLKKKPHIIVGTPGKVQELLQQKKLKMHAVKTIVLDEGDTLIVPEHFDTIAGIVKSTMKERQVVLFSATVTPNIMEALAQLMDNPIDISIKRDDQFMGKVDHMYFVCEKRDKIAYLERIARLQDVKALVFMKDIGDMNLVSSKLKFKELPIAILHSESSKSERENALKSFRKGQVSMLLCTDVAARGLDIKGLTTVVHYDLPRTLEQYTHRSGRTGRAGNDGTVISIITPSEEKELKQLTKKLDLQVEKKEFYKGKIVEAKRENKPQRPVKKPGFKINKK